MGTTINNPKFVIQEHFARTYHYDFRLDYLVRLEKNQTQYQVFIESLEEDDCPGGLEHAMQALWYDANGDWERVHEIVQQMDGVAAARIHAYLHRVE